MSANSDVSPQWFSKMELSDTPGTPYMNQLIEAAFRGYIRHKREELSRLEDDLAKYGNRLIEQVNERGEAL
jgi:hypothetical protein